MTQARGILITGASGQVGTELLRRSWPAGFEPIPLGRDTLDLRDTAAIGDLLDQGYGDGPWAAVVNAAAYTAVDKAETEQLDAWRINALAPAAFAEACARNAVPLVQISTDYVFDGSKLGAWEVDDPVGPLNVYGASKLGGELAVRTSGARFAVLRTSWVMSAHGANFIKTMLRLAGERSHLRVVADQHGTPTSAADLAAAAMHIAIELAHDTSMRGGVFQFSNSQVTTWADFATEIFRQSALRSGPYATVEKIMTKDFPTPALRPRNSLLSNTAIHEAFGVTPRPWSEALSEILDELLGDAR